MSKDTTHTIGEIARQKGLFTTTTGREPSYVIMNEYTYRGLIGQLAHQAITEDPTITFESAIGVPVAVIPMDKRDEIYVEVV